MKLATKFVSVSVMGIIATGTILVLTVLAQKNALKTGVTEEMDKVAQQECRKIAHDVYLMLQVQHETLLKKLEADMRVAKELLERQGSVSLSTDAIAWEAVNQLSGHKQPVTLPKMMVGNQWLGKNDEVKAASAVVDKVRSLVGGTCTIFQRMNSAGDMLRVCTNVETADGHRAIGTFIAASNPDGTRNWVISAVLRGQTYVGRAYVVNDWYLAAYAPLYDAKKDVIGLIYVGVKQESVPELRKGIMKAVVGKTGYVYVLCGSGKDRGKYVISHNAERDGESIWESQDADGHSFIQSAIGKALATRGGECAIERYPWRNPGESRSRAKVAAVTYFEPWDWVIGAGTYEDEFHDSIAHIDTALNQLVLWTIAGAVVALVVCGGVSVLAGRQLNRAIGGLVSEARRLSTAAVEGKLQTRGNPDLVSLEFRPIVEGVNATLDAVIGPLDVTAEYVDRISKGDIPPKITDTYYGDFNEIKDNLNACIDALGGLIGR